MLDNQKLVDLPNLGRNPFMLSKLVPNVIQVGNPAYNRMQDQSGSSQISIAGGPVRGNNYLLDGVPITDAANRAIIIPSAGSRAGSKDSGEYVRRRNGPHGRRHVQHADPLGGNRVCTAAFMDTCAAPTGTRTASSTMPAGIPITNSRTAHGAQA